MKTPKRRTFTFRDGEATQSFQKKRGESIQHVLTKAILWKLHREEYSNIQIERDIQDPDGYLPDCVALGDRTGVPVFWGESGRVSVTKAVDLARRYPHTHICQLRWSMELEDFAKDTIAAIYAKDDDIVTSRTAKYEFGSLPNDVWKFFDSDGNILVTRQDLSWMEL
jgi:hypothetical protein